MSKQHRNFNALNILASIGIFFIANFSNAATNTEVLGFESAQFWTTSSGAISVSSTASQGQSSLALTTQGYTELTSIPLTSLYNVSSELALDINLPSVLGWGEVQLVLNSPSAGIYSQWIGQETLAGLAANTFHSVVFPLTSATQTLLSSSYTDLTIKIVLITPGLRLPILLDNLHFINDGQTSACGDGSPFTLSLSINGQFDDGIEERIRCLFYDIYPQLVSRFNPSAQTLVPIFIEDFNGIAYADNTGIHANRSYLLANPMDTDVFVHELMHIVQHYVGVDAPGYFTEGIADYVRNIYGLTNAQQGWTLQPYSYGVHYYDGYGVVANWLIWLENNYSFGSIPLVDQLDSLIREGTYTHGFWIQWTGLTIDELWVAYSVAQGAINGQPPAPMPAQQGVTVYEDAGYGGKFFKFDEGEYLPIDQTANGVPHNWFDGTQGVGISSLVVPAGYRIILYPSFDLTGEAFIFESDSDFIGELNDSIHSFRVELITSE